MTTLADLSLGNPIPEGFRPEMTWTEAGRLALGDNYSSAPDDVISLLLWSRTAFPFASVAHTLQQLREYATDPRDEDGNPEEPPKWDAKP